MGRQTHPFTYCKLHEVQRRIWKVTHYPTINSVGLLVRTRSIYPWLVRVVSDRSVRYSIMESTRHLAGKPEVASPNVGCFLRLLMLTSEDVCWSIRNVKFDIIKVSYTMGLLFLMFVTVVCVIPFNLSIFAQRWRGIRRLTFGDKAFSMLAIANWTFSSSKSAPSISPLISSSLHGHDQSLRFTLPSTYTCKT